MNLAFLFSFVLEGAWPFSSHFKQLSHHIERTNPGGGMSWCQHLPKAVVDKADHQVFSIGVVSTFIVWLAEESLLFLESRALKKYMPLMRRNGQ